LIAVYPQVNNITLKIDDQDNLLLRQTCDQMLDMEEFTKSMEGGIEDPEMVIEDKDIHRFMSHQINFDTEIDDKPQVQKELKFQNDSDNELEMPLAQDSSSSGWTSESESSEEQKSAF
jgi:hypothetical protein